MKERYITLMEKTLWAYSNEHIIQYIDSVKEKGLTEHGFPRLTANIGILIAHGKRLDLLNVFIEMMDLCCDMFLRPFAKAANEFSVREIVCCINELEKAKTVNEELITLWKQKISQIDPGSCYNKVVENETDRITNWAIFGALSEYARFYFGLGENLDFVDRQLSCQFQWIDESGMYRDNSKELIHQPIMYDYVSRGLFAMLLHWGYRGKYYEQIDDCLRRSGILTLKMQSTTGEIPFGGRSNQFLHNEAWMILICEYEARRYAKEGNMELAMTFKSAIARALNITEAWLSKKPIRHIKNRFPTETKYGCEGYAYFDKYMITAASNLYAAYLLCDDSIPTSVSLDYESVAFQTSYHFHKLFLKSGGYALEFDTNADPHYDANGLGRVHREGAPSTICLSCPCPPNPIITLDFENPFAFSLCSGIRVDGEWVFGANAEARYEISESNCDDSHAFATVLCENSGKTLKEIYSVNEKGVNIKVLGHGEIGYTLPAFCFDGESKPEITCLDNTLSISYDGWVCRYTTNAVICDLGKEAANRNGHYHAFVAVSNDELDVKIEIFPIQ